MKVAPFSTFRKLWGVIETDVQKGEIIVDIQNNYDVSRWDGTKSIVLSNASAFGGKNTFLGIVFIAAGSFCLFCALLFTLTGVVFKGNNDGEDPRSWKYS